MIGYLEKYLIAYTRLIEISSEEEDCIEIFCRLHEKEYLGSHENGSHNCLACNLQDGNLKLIKFLDSIKEINTHQDHEYVITIFYLLLYLQIEKMHTIFKIIGITMDYVEKNWPVLIEIRKWANFIKHPKGFLFTHHPKYIFENESISKSNNQIIDYEIVIKFYNRESDDSFKKSIHEMGNKKNLIVLVPSPERIINEYVIVCREFCDKIKLNPHFKDVLKEHSTIIDY